MSFEPASGPRSTPEGDAAVRRRLEAEVHRLRDDNAELHRRLAYAWQEVERLRARLLEGKRVLQAAEPAPPESRAEPAILRPVTAAELEVALARLRQVRPRSLP